MKFSVLFLSFCFICCQSILFIDECRTDADCNIGCCRTGTSLGLANECVQTYIQLHQTCHLSGFEFNNCGCAKGLICVNHVDTGSQAIAVEGGGIGVITGTGHCEKANGTASSGGSLVATEG